jgi:hypothetical protein
MIEKDLSKFLVLTKHPIFENLEIEENDQRELVILYGYISQVSERTVRFYQSFDLRSFMEINRNEIVLTEPYDATSPSSQTKLIVFASAELTMFTTTIKTMKAGALANAIKLQNESDTMGGVSSTQESFVANANPLRFQNSLRVAATGPPVCPEGCWSPSGCTCLKKAIDPI